MSSNLPLVHSSRKELPPSKRWLMPLLVVSLAGNFLVAGLVLTHLWRGENEPRGAGTSFTQLLPRDFIADMPKDRKHIVLDILGQYRKPLRDQRDLTRTVTLQLADAIAAEPYNAAAVETLLQNYASQTGQLAQTGGTALREILNQLTPQERQALARNIRQRAVEGRRGAKH